MSSLTHVSTQRHTVATAENSAGITVITIRGSEHGVTLAVLGGVHGGEWEGVAAVGQLHRILRTQPIVGQVTLVPVCNEPAYDATRRRSPIDGLDLARSFPGDPRGSITQRLAAVIGHRVIQPADFIIDLHSAGLAYTMPTLVGFIDGEPPGSSSSLEGALAFGAPVIWRHPPPPPPGRTLSVAYEHGIPCLYAETTGGGSLRYRDVETYTHGVMNVMRYLSMLPEDVPEPGTPVRLYGGGDLDTATVRAHHPGILLSHVDLLQRVVCGDVIATVTDQMGEVLETLVADRSGTVVMLRHDPRVVQGDAICYLTDEADAVRGGP